MAEGNLPFEFEVIFCVRGVATPTLANMTLAGLEQVAINAAPRHHKINVVIYADDFVITGSSKEVLEMQVKPAVEAILL